MRRLASLILTAAGLAAPARASVIYDNTTNDTLRTIVFGAGPYSELGDEIQLDGAERLLTRATVQFFNEGQVGSFDAVLRLYRVGAPVGAPLGSFAVTGIAAPQLGVFDVVFDNLAFQLSVSQIVFTVSLENVTPGVGPGLNLFAPPGIAGTSDNGYFIAADISRQYSQVSSGNGNLYFRLEAENAPSSTIPELATWISSAAGGLVLLIRRRRQSSGRR